MQYYIGLDNGGTTTKAALYDELGNDFDTYDTQDIESGIIKEVAKTLLLGGMVRLTTDMLKKE